MLTTPAVRPTGAQPAPPPHLPQPPLTSAALSLPQLLDQFQHMLLVADDAVPAALASRLAAGPIAGFGVNERLQIYRHAYRARLIDALRDTFGHCARYLDAQFDGTGDRKGDSAFERLAAAYVQTHPSATHNINHYGHDWPQWLAEHLARWPEVAELATLDWHLRRAFDGPDAVAMALPDLAAWVDGPGWASQPLCPVPTFCRLQFGTDALALWQAIDQDAPAPASTVLPTPVPVAVWRVGERPHFRSMDAFEDLALQALATQRCFGGMCEALRAQLGQPAQMPGGDTPPKDEVARAAGMLLRRWVEEGMLSADHAEPVPTVP